MDKPNDYQMAKARQKAATVLNDANRTVMAALGELYTTAWEEGRKSMLPENQPLEVGQVVKYHGSKTYMHGQYRVVAVVPPPIGMADYYPDGVMYSLWEVGYVERYGNRDHSLSRVRRKSMTVTTLTDLCELCGEPDSPAVVDPYLAEVEGETRVRRLCGECFDVRKDQV